jgi:heme/copper-type cytochrome/quinol oxidase subunit 1
MSTLDPAVHQPAADTAPAVPAVVAVLASSDHKVIGRLLIGAALAATLVSGGLGFVLGLERIGGDGTTLPARLLPELFAGYRVGLVLGGVVPLLLGLSVAVVPLQLGARSLAFPRLAAAGFWAWLGGTALLIVALFNNGGPNGGDADMVLLYIGSLALMVLGLTAVATTVVTSVLTTRAPGLKLRRAPLFAWSALVGALGTVLVLPVALGALVYVYLDSRYAGADTTLFGGAAGVDDWTTWILTGPTLALFAAPAVGICAELLPVVLRTRLPMRGAALAGLGLVGTGVLAGVTQLRQIVLPGTGTPVNGHNWLTKLGILADWAIFTLLPALGIVVVLGLGALAAKPPATSSGRPQLTRSAPYAPLAFALLGVLIALGGVVANAVDGIEDLALSGTVFEEGAAVAIVYGSILAGLGGLAYWAPKWTGRKLPDVPLYGLAVLGAAGAAVAAGSYLVAGFTDQPGYAAVWDNDGPGALWNTLAMLGHGTFALVIVAFAGLLFRPAAGAKDAATGDDPWDGHTLEWATTSPAPLDNFATVPLVRSAEPLLDLKEPRQ